MSVFKSVTERDLADPSVKWIDARFSLKDPAEGRRQYEAAHIQGAVHWDLEKDLSDMQKKGGRHPLPDRQKMEELFRKSGLQLDDEIIIYDGGGEPFAARAWWILIYAGFRHVSIALQGFEQLKTLGAETEREIAVPEPTGVEPKWNDGILAVKEDVASMTDQTDSGLLIDARAPERYRGEHEPLDKIAGHIPGAENFDWAQLAPDGMFETDGEASARLLGMAGTGRQITVYCGSGVTAAPLFAMLHEKGKTDIRLYAGSYSDWIEDGDKEVETGGRL
ncbi:thiosulfate sulfurtransferase [Sporosarcina sp. NCCP-2716]|uniref:sulfurtransferase n=1 Tax=Sporosarcina sp. NCCP-2716 TaxID=2943679 RepID=UPI00204208A2|nr:sulfurtransferase [Sporosarcina sp. NCCP-2716]GKV67990.1 thiosulfate sulfurtransferase [Sporosarcina sp. NCCP-2716]